MDHSDLRVALQVMNRPDVELAGLTQAPIHPHNRSLRRRITAILLFATLSATACGGSRPTVTGWEVTWANTVAIVEEAVASDIAQQECDDILAYLRVQRTTLSPVPLDDLETPVDSWFSVAESVFFECDVTSDGAQESLETLQAVEAEVQAVLEVES
jgi:hypothetical protein